jgi:hypothetical protein
MSMPRQAEGTELHPWETKVLDVAGCDRTEIVVALYEHETAGTRPETWPQVIQNLIFKYAGEWVDEHPERAVRAVSYAAPKYKQTDRQCCVMIIHHAPKG